jgi:hypothetical protein
MGSAARARRGAHRREREPVLARGSEAIQRRQVRRGAVSLVAREVITRTGPIELAHQRIAVCLGQDRGGADRGHRRIAAHHCLDAAAEIGERRSAIAVDLHVRRAHREAEQCAAHGEQRRFEDIDRVDLGAPGAADRPGERARADQRREPLARRLTQRLGIAQTLDGTGRIENHRRGDDRTGERSATGLVHAGGERPRRTHERLSGARASWRSTASAASPAPSRRSCRCTRSNSTSSSWR